MNSQQLYLDDMEVGELSLENMESAIRDLVRRGGPQVSDYPRLHALVEEIYRRNCRGEFAAAEMERLRVAFGTAFRLETLQGFAFAKPHGYPGDFEMIDRVYQYCITPTPELANWDRFFQLQGAPQAVRNRKAYFLRYLRHCSLLAAGPLRVLNLACGPCRDVLEFFREFGEEAVRFDCLDQDPSALAYAENLCRGYSHSVRFIRGSAYSFRPEGRYDIVWSAGLFDYFEDRLFCRMLKRFLDMVEGGGQMVIGNFSPTNPTRAYMRLFDWELNYRSEDQLLGLAVSCGISRDRLSIGREPSGINLFLHIRCP